MSDFIEKETKKANSRLFASDRQLADRYQVKRVTIWRWAKKGIFPAPVKLSPGCTRWPMDLVLEYEQKQMKQTG